MQEQCDNVIHNMYIRYMKYIRNIYKVSIIVGKS